MRPVVLYILAEPSFPGCLRSPGINVLLQLVIRTSSPIAVASDLLQARRHRHRTPGEQAHVLDIFPFSVVHGSVDSV